MKHKHDFQKHLGVRTPFGVLAWVPQQFVNGGFFDPLPEMWRCVECGEQGYEVR